MPSQKVAIHLPGDQPWPVKNLRGAKIGIEPFAKKFLETYLYLGVYWLLSWTLTWGFV
jgi:hypothetical protein